MLTGCGRRSGALKLDVSDMGHIVPKFLAPLEAEASLRRRLDLWFPLYGGTSEMAAVGRRRRSRLGLRRASSARPNGIGRRQLSTNASYEQGSQRRAVSRLGEGIWISSMSMPQGVRMNRIALPSPAS